jgi:hypothetical protein
MREIAKRVWLEPAAFIGLVTTAAIVAITLISGDHWDLATICGAIAPLASALGIRQLVTPTEKTGQLVAKPPAGETGQ